VQPERHRGDVVASLFEKQGRHRRVNATAHRGDNAPAATTPCLGAVQQHLARSAVPVVFEGLVQRVENERQRVFLADGKRAAQGVFDVDFGDAGRLEEVSVRHQLRQRRPGGDTRRAAVRLVSDLFQEVVGDPDREACDVAAGLVAGFTAA
jgi:hypothetical protein